LNYYICNYGLRYECIQSGEKLACLEWWRWK